MINCLDIGCKGYLEVFELQKILHDQRVHGQIPDTLILCEHYPVFTLGRQDSSFDWISDFKTVAREGIDVVQTNRGGRITYHGPGQLVAYFIFNIERFGVKTFVNMVEAAVISTLSEFSISAERNKDYPGIWVGDKKIAALGFYISNKVSMHGLALNVMPNMSHFRHIIPCGIKDKGITSIKNILGTPVLLKEVGRKLGHFIGEVFDQALTFSTEEKVSKPSSWAASI